MVLAVVNDEEVAFDLDAAMTKLKLGIRDLTRLTGRKRGTIWLWRSSGRCPVYVKTIMEQVAMIRRLSAALGR